MRKFISTWALLACLTACDGTITINSQSNKHSETSVSENNETVINGDTTITRKNKKEKHNEHDEHKTRIGFNVEDKTGLSDKFKKRLEKELGDDDDTTAKKSGGKNNSDDEPVAKKSPKVNSNSSKLKARIACETGISPDEFEDAKVRLSKAFMDDDKVRRGKQLFNNVCLTSKQAQELVSLLRIDDQKLDLAKFLYGRTIDKGKFMRVADEFMFEEYKDKLARYIED